MKDLAEKIILNDIWNISGSFGRVQSDSTDTYEIKAEYRKDENGVYYYTGKFKNISAENIVLNCLKARFHLGGGEFEVYTQYNGWQNENIGKWQELNTEISVSAKSIRTTYGAAPFMAVRNKQTGRGIVFHLLADYAWSMQARVVPKDGEIAEVQVEIGVNSENFFKEIGQGECIKTPEIIFYEFKNRLDLDCRKLHSYCLKNYKRKQMPVVYNTWLCRFDKINYENVENQIEKAAKIDAEYFVVDAGWFGSGTDWWSYRGDWTENKNGAFCGRMLDISQKVRECGMKFGLWFEIESASAGAKILNTHKDCFIQSDEKFFLDFSKKKARKYIFGVLKENIDKYNIEYIKLDFNQDTDYDNAHMSYMEYYSGYREVIMRIKNEYPNIYLENCAAGGMRADLRNSRDFDSFWLSDNQSPYEGMRIFKEGIKRLPPQCIEKWAALRTVKEFSPVYENNEKEKILSSDDATWDRTVGVHQSFLNGFLSGGPMGISCDLNCLSDDLLKQLALHTENFKKERDFWENAVCGILTDSDKTLVLEYSAYNKIKIIVYTYKIMQDSVYVYPNIDTSAVYLINGREVRGCDIAENGLHVRLSGNYRCEFLDIERK